jgi:hypothetical protein
VLALAASIQSADIQGKVETKGRFDDRQQTPDGTLGSPISHQCVAASGKCKEGSNPSNARQFPQTRQPSWFVDVALFERAILTVLDSGRPGSPRYGRTAPTSVVVAAADLAPARVSMDALRAANS